MAAKKIDPIVRPCAYCGKQMLLGGRGRKPKKAKYCSRRCLAFGRVTQAKIAILSSEEAAYFAGFFDGEGSVILYPGGFGGRPRLRVSFANTHLPTLEWMKLVCETGSIVTKAPWTKPEQLHYKTSYTWQCYGSNAVSLLEQMLPYLIQKREKALEGIASQEVQRVV